MGRSPVHAFVALLLLTVFAVVVVDGRIRRRRRHEFGGLGKGNKLTLTKIIASETPREKRRNHYAKDVTPCDIVHSECLDMALTEQQLNKTKLKEQCAWALSDANKALHMAELTALNRLIKVSGRTRFCGSTRK